MLLLPPSVVHVTAFSLCGPPTCCKTGCAHWDHLFLLTVTHTRTHNHINTDTTHTRTHRPAACYMVPARGGLLHLSLSNLNPLAQQQLAPISGPLGLGFIKDTVMYTAACSRPISSSQCSQVTVQTNGMWLSGQRNVLECGADTLFRLFLKHIMAIKSSLYIFVRVLQNLHKAFLWITYNKWWPYSDSFVFLRIISELHNSFCRFCFSFIKLNCGLIIVCRYSFSHGFAYFSIS